MQEDFHYYATYSAAYIAGFSHEESMIIAFCDNFTDSCTHTFLNKIGGPHLAQTTQLTLEMADTRTDALGLQMISRTWASFHFLPGDLYAEVKGSKKYKDKYRLICNPNSDLVVKTVNLAKGKDLSAIGLSMHILSDTWAHRYFAGTPSLVINNVPPNVYEIFPDGHEELLEFWSKPGRKEDVDKRNYINSIFQPSENSVMNLGHGRCGHLPDYSFIRYKYMPAWKNYDEVIKDNPSDYMHAFTQMIYALKFLRGNEPFFEKDHYDTEAISKWKDEITSIFEKRQINSNEDWKKFGEKLTGKSIPDYDPDRFNDEYMNASEDEKPETVLGKFFNAAISQKAMVTDEVFKSGNKLLGISKKVRKEK